MNDTQQQPQARPQQAAAFARYNAAKQFYESIRAKQVKRLFALLFKGGKYSTKDLVQVLNIADPRAVVRDLKNQISAAGLKFTICTRWEHPADGARHKRYWME